MERTVSQPLILNSYATRSCPRLTHNEFDPTAGDTPTLAAPPLVETLTSKGLEFESEVFQRCLEVWGDECVDLTASSSSHPLTNEERVDLTISAMRFGARIILGGYLPDDLTGGRRGRPDLLIRDDEWSADRPRYVAGDVKHHSMVKKSTKGSVSATPIENPSLGEVQLVEGWALDVTHAADWLQVAHYRRMLHSLGWGGERHVAVVLGSRGVADLDPALVWIDLDTVRVESYDEDGTPVTRSVLDEYDFQFAHRQRVADVALRQGSSDSPTPLVEPVFQEECLSCPWREYCPSQLAKNDASWTLELPEANSRRVWELLRSHGVSTLDDLATLDPSGETAKAILNRVHHPTVVKKRLEQYQVKADMIRRGVRVERVTSEPLAVPAFDVEIDFDIEWLPGEPPYLYGFLLRTPELDGVYSLVSQFQHLDETSGRELARRALQWMMDRRDEARKRGLTFGVFHYSHPERSEVTKALLGEREGELPEGVQSLMDDFVDLHDIIKRHFRGVHGLGLKEIATYGAGFSWRDEEPGGLNSQVWAERATAGDGDSRDRVLQYNEDDVRATAALRAWMKSLSTTRNG
jgi:predicted RecB family nuclease